MEKLSEDVEEKLKAFRAFVDDLSLRVSDPSKGDMHQVAKSYNKVLLAHQTLLVEIERLNTLDKAFKDRPWLVEGTETKPVAPYKMSCCGELQGAPHGFHCKTREFP